MSQFGVSQFILQSLPDFLTEVAQGNVPDHAIGTKFGRNPVVNTNTTPQDMWNAGGTYTGQPVNFTPETVHVFSSDINDASGGTGARTVEIFGLRTSTSTNYESEIITLNGGFVVTSVNTWWRINRATILTAGSGGANAGTIKVQASATNSNVFVFMPIGYNQTTIGAFTVPFSRSLLIKRIRTTITRANGNPGSATVSLKSRPPGGVYNSIRVFELHTGSTTQFHFSGGLPIEPGSDLKWTIESVSDNGTVAEAVFEFLLMV